MTAPELSILVTAHKEAATIGRALTALHSQEPEAEVIVICPDDETAEAARPTPGVTVLRDPGQGKPAALNIGLKQARGRIIVLTDGDVTVGEGALSALLEPFHDPQVGAVSGRPISVSPRDTLLGYWSHLLTDAGAHTERTLRDTAGQYLMCSGYLYAIRAGLVEQIPEDALAEDAVVSHLIAERGYRIRYSPGAEVFVKYPTTYRDWLKQKTRSAGGYAQPILARSSHRIRSLRGELTAGFWRALRYPQSPREFMWTLLLFGARLHLWLRVFWRVRVLHQPLTTLWKRVESTK